MRLGQIINKFVLPGFITAITVDSWLIARNQQRREIADNILRRSSQGLLVSSQLVKRSFVTNSGRILEDKLGEKLVINSTPDNIVFDNDKSVLMLPPLISIEGIIKNSSNKGEIINNAINNDVLQCKDLVLSLSTLVNNLDWGYYKFEWYIHVSDLDNNLEDEIVLFNFDSSNNNTLNTSYCRSGYSKFFISLTSLNDEIHHNLVVVRTMYGLTKRLRVINEDKDQRRLLELSKDTLVVITKVDENFKDPKENSFFNKMKLKFDFNKRSFSTNSKDKNQINKLVINSNHSNLVFEDNKAILWIIINDHIAEVVKNLKNGYYTFHFYSYIQNLNKNPFVLKDNNSELVLCKDNSSYKSWMSLIVKKDIGEKCFSDSWIKSNIYRYVSERIRYLSDEAVNRDDIDFENKILLVISKVNSDQFNKYDYKKGIQPVYDLSSYSFMGKDGIISIYNPIIVNNTDSKAGSKKLVNTNILLKGGLEKKRSYSTFNIWDTKPKFILSSNKRSFATSSMDDKYPIDKLVINSTPDNIVFDNDKSVLILSPLEPFSNFIDFKNIEYLDEEKRKFIDDNELYTDIHDNLLSKFTSFKGDLSKIRDNLDCGYYKFQLYLYINDSKNEKEPVHHIYIVNKYEIDTLNLGLGSYGYKNFYSNIIDLNNDEERRVFPLSFRSLITDYLQHAMYIEMKNLLLDFNKETLLIITKINKEDMYGG